MKLIKPSFLIFLLFIVESALSQVAPVDKQGLALGGYDVVAYFSNKAAKGDSKITAIYNMATYQFSTTVNRDAFNKNPTKYLPQFDGYCAWGVGVKGIKMSTNPETFKIIDGKLYFFFNGSYGGTPFNAFTLWSKDETNILKNAIANWPSVKEKK